MNKDNFTLGEKVHIYVGGYHDQYQHFKSLSYQTILDNKYYSIMTDGSINILLSKEEVSINQYTLIYFADDLGHKQQYLNNTSITYNETNLFNSNTLKINYKNILVYIVEQDLSKYPKQDLVMLNETNPQSLSHYPQNTCGLFGELSFPVDNLKEIIEFWQNLNYKTVINTIGDYPWGIVTDSLTLVGLHQTNNFSKPTVTYFAKDMEQRINSLKNKKEITIKNVGDMNPNKAAKIIAPNGWESFLFEI